jgi:hypothetical protein
MVARQEEELGRICGMRGIIRTSSVCRRRAPGVKQPESLSRSGRENAMFQGSRRVEGPGASLPASSIRGAGAGRANTAPHPGDLAVVSVDAVARVAALADAGTGLLRRTGQPRRRGCCAAGAPPFSRVA